jgi:DNA-binding NarL/FixJ family response regulator
MGAGGSMSISQLYRVSMADDHIVARRGVRAMLTKKEKPDLLPLDLTMPEMNKLEAVRSVREQSHSSDILILTMHFLDELARECLGGAHTYILKSDADGELHAAVDHIGYRQSDFTGQLAATMTEKFLRSPGVAESAIPGPRSRPVKSKWFHCPLPAKSTKRRPELSKFPSERQRAPESHHA